MRINVTGDRTMGGQQCPPQMPSGHKCSPSFRRRPRTQCLSHRVSVVGFPAAPHRGPVHAAARSAGQKGLKWLSATIASRRPSSVGSKPDDRLATRCSFRPSSRTPALTRKTRLPGLAPFQRDRLVCARYSAARLPIGPPLTFFSRSPSGPEGKRRLVQGIDP